MVKKLKDLIKMLSETPGPPGCEQKAREVIAEEIKSYCKNLYEDFLGNLIAKKDKYFWL